VRLIRFGCVLSLLIASAASAVTIDWVPIGNPGNLADTEVMTCCGESVGTTGYGSVPYSYQIAKYKVSNAQYVGFLNAVAAIHDTYGLWAGFGLIQRSGNAGNYTYSVNQFYANNPVEFANYFDALRFANWLHNGQPTGLQDTTTTENGSYTITGSPFQLAPRNPGATVVIPTEDEWYKAAYYDPADQSYNDYANIIDAPTRTDQPSPYGTFDQGASSSERTETRGNPSTDDRIVRGGYGVAAFYRQGYSASAATTSVGFRLVMIPEPSTGLLVIAGLLGLAGWRTRRIKCH
jgi:Sulfatase-modifying factor enzyme 1/PEP-CTERM motif